MGQYYVGSILKKNWREEENPVEFAIKPHCVKEAAKLMEHSYIGNGYVNMFMQQLGDDGKYFGYPFVWAGDYADKANGKEINDCAVEVSNRIFDSVDMPFLTRQKEYKYLVNFTKNEYIEMPKYDDNVWQVHPLPLLTCIGNGRGCGDYYCENEHVGRWAFDEIGATDKEEIVENMKKMDIFFELDY